MAIQVQHRRGTTAEIASFTGAVGEIVVDTTKDTAVVMDGSLAGGYPLMKENNPAMTGNLTMQTSGTYIQFADGTKQYTATPQIFYMILPGTLYTPLTGSSRYYPINNITINTIYYNFSQASTSSVSFSVLVNGTIINTYTINAGVYNGSITSLTIAVSNTSYVTINVNSGNGSDLTLRFAYT
jgi:hypothetical protein